MTAFNKESINSEANEQIKKELQEKKRLEDEEVRKLNVPTMVIETIQELLIAMEWNNFAEIEGPEIKSALVYEGVCSDASPNGSCVGNSKLINWKIKINFGTNVEEIFIIYKDVKKNPKMNSPFSQIKNGDTFRSKNFSTSDASKESLLKLLSDEAILIVKKNLDKKF